MRQKIIRIPLFGKTLSLQFRVWYKKISTHYGVTNETVDGYYLPFWDFAEEFKLGEIMDSLRQIQNRFDLSTIYVFQSYPSESYRAVCFDKMIWTESIGVIGSTECLDDQYLRFSVMRGRFVLRLTDKIEREDILVESVYSAPERSLSLDHQAFFSAKYPAIPQPVPYPSKVNVRLSQYESFR